MVDTICGSEYCSAAYAIRRRLVTRLKIKTTRATTNSMWIKPPPTCKLNPSNHRIKRIVKIVQSMISSSLSVVSTREDSSSRMHRHIQVQLVLCSYGLRFRAPNCTQEGFCRRSGRDLAQQYVSGRNIAPVDRLHRIVVAAYRSAVQREAGEDAPGSRIGENFRFHFPIGIGGGVSSHRPGCYGSICSNLEFARKQLLHAFFVLDDHDQIDALESDLQAPATAREAKKRWCTPPLGGSAGCYASSMSSTNDEAALDHVRYDGDASCMFQDFFRDPVIRRCHDFV